MVWQTFSITNLKENKKIRCNLDNFALSWSVEIKRLQHSV